MTWDDVDFESNVLHIRPKAGWKPKTGDARRVPMTDRVRTILAGRERDFLWVFTAAPSRKYPDGGNQISERRLIIEASAQEDWTFSSG